MGLQEAEAFSEYARDLSDYLLTLEQRLFSEGLHTLGHAPTSSEMEQYLSAYYGDQLPAEVRHHAVSKRHMYCSK